MNKFSKKLIYSAVATFLISSSYGQGKAGIDAAASELTTYIDPVGNLIMIIGAIVGLVGAVRVYLKWNAGDQDVQKAVMGWVGACIFLVVSGILVKAFFGV